MKKAGSNSSSKEPITNIQYSKNNGAWTAYTYGDNISVVSGDKIRWKGTKKDGNAYRYYSSFVATANYIAYGNPLSLLNNDDFVNEPDAIYNYAYYRLFENNSTLKEVSDLVLPAATLNEYCYAYMFYGCTGLTSVPSNLLPATTLATACYAYMFYGCTSLATAPNLPARTLVKYCYEYMFSDCTSLTTAPELQATTLTVACYRGMFYNCTNLNYIKCIANDILAYLSTYEWTHGVASTGTFVKNATMTKWTTGKNGIPSGWTVQNA